MPCIHCNKDFVADCPEYGCEHCSHPASIHNYCVLPYGIALDNRIPPCSNPDCGKPYHITYKSVKEYLESFGDQEYDCKAELMKYATRADKKSPSLQEQWLYVRKKLESHVGAAGDLKKKLAERFPTQCGDKKTNSVLNRILFMLNRCAHITDDVLKRDFVFHICSVCDNRGKRHSDCLLCGDYLCPEHSRDCEYNHGPFCDKHFRYCKKHCSYCHECMEYSCAQNGCDEYTCWFCDIDTDGQEEGAIECTQGCGEKFCPAHIRQCDDSACDEYYCEDCGSLDNECPLEDCSNTLCGGKTHDKCDGCQRPMCIDHDERLFSEDGGKAFCSESCANDSDYFYCQDDNCTNGNVLEMSDGLEFCKYRCRHRLCEDHRICNKCDKYICPDFPCRCGREVGSVFDFCDMKKAMGEAVAAPAPTGTGEAITAQIPPDMGSNETLVGKVEVTGNLWYVFESKGKKLYRVNSKGMKKTYLSSDSATLRQRVEYFKKG